MPEISEQEARHVASLAKLALADQEIQRLGHELRRILEYFHQLEQLDTDQVLTTSHAVQMQNVYRRDQVSTSLEVEEAVSNAPDRVDQFFRVPQIIEE